MRYALWFLLAMLLVGCLDPSYARTAGMLRYSGGTPDPAGIGARGDAYVACTVADNSSFDALDACMAKSGYQRNDK